MPLPPVVAPRPAADGVVRSFDVAVQRAVGAGLAAALVHGVAVASVGRALYAWWWWWGPAPATLVLGAAAVYRCAHGRLDATARGVLAAGVAASAVLTAAAADPSVRDVGTPLLSLVIVTLVGIGLLAHSAAAAALGGLVVLADTVATAAVRASPIEALVTQAAIQCMFLAGMVVTGRLARRVGANEERARDELAQAYTADRAAVAAHAERRELERELHDTVLNTLSALARGGLGDSAAVRRRCAADVTFLRTLGGEDTRADLLHRLQAIVATVAQDDFTVTLSCPEDCQEVPGPVATALSRAAREALVNARSHSASPGATVWVRCDDEAVVVGIVDAGQWQGSTHGSADRLGLRRSVVERMSDVGGRAEIVHKPGLGTAVTLRWPA